MSTALLGLAAHLPVVPVLLPAVTAVVMLLLGDDAGGVPGRHAVNRLAWARRIAIVSTMLGGVVALMLALRAAEGELMVYRLGDWPAPFGIVLVVDRLGAMMLALTSLVALPALGYASGGWDRRGRHFHALFQFQLMGLNGAFVTGDLFNLFVFFEVLLIASYVLMLHGLGRERLAAGLHYVVLNLAASALFLVGVSLLYAKTGTLNLADLSLRVPEVVGPDAAIVQSAALLLLVVFGFKAALLPLAAWLPATYTAAAAPVAALFALMTKVGVYAIVRMHGVVFGDQAGASASVAAPFLLPLALATTLLGALGALAARSFERLVAWLTVASVGTILAAVGLYNDAGWSAAFFYLVNSTLVIACLFMFAELAAAQRGGAGGLLVPAAALAQPVRLGLLLLLAAAAAAGLPPLPGFLGKLMLLQAASAHPWQATVWGVVVGGSFLTLIGLARAGSILFWDVRPSAARPAGGASARLVAACALPLAAVAGMTMAAAPLQRYTDAAAAQLRDRAGYARAVLGPAAAQASTTRPYRFEVRRNEGGRQ